MAARETALEGDSLEAFTTFKQGISEQLDELLRSGFIYNMSLPNEPTRRILLAPPDAFGPTRLQGLQHIRLQSYEGEGGEGESDGSGGVVDNYHKRVASIDLAEVQTWIDSVGAGKTSLGAGKTKLGAGETAAKDILYVDAAEHFQRALTGINSAELFTCTDAVQEVREVLYAGQDRQKPQAGWTVITLWVTAVAGLVDCWLYLLEYDRAVPLISALIALRQCDSISIKGGSHSIADLEAVVPPLVELYYQRAMFLKCLGLDPNLVVIETGALLQSLSDIEACESMLPTTAKSRDFASQLATCKREVTQQLQASATRRGLSRPSAEDFQSRAIAWSTKAVRPGDPPTLPAFVLPHNDDECTASLDHPHSRLFTALSQRNATDSRSIAIKSLWMTSKLVRSRRAMFAWGTLKHHRRF